MARPHKTGLDYFPQDTDIFSDRKIKRLIATFGADGFMVNERIKTMIYQDKGYYIHNDEHLAFDVADSLGDGITEAKVKKIIDASVGLGLFNKPMFETENILTSSGIQKRYLMAKRHGIIADKIKVIADETIINAATTPETAAESTQRKEKESKEKERERKGKESKQPARADLEIDLLEFLNKKVAKYYPDGRDKARHALEKFSQTHGITQEAIDADPALQQKFIREEDRLIEKHLTTPMRKDIDECYTYYAARNFQIDRLPIENWRAIIAGWLNKRDTFKTKTR